MNQTSFGLLLNDKEFGGIRLAQTSILATHTIFNNFFVKSFYKNHGADIFIHFIILLSENINKKLE